MPLSVWPQIRSAIPQDPEIEAAVAALRSSMSLEQKVGQMIQAEILAITPEQVRDHHIGSVLNGGGSWPGQRKNATVGDWVALADDYYDASAEGGIPVLWGTDAVHGHSNVMGATLFPHNIGLGAARDPDLIERIGVVTAREVAATGLDWTFAPTLAAVRDDRWGRTYEGYSEDPDIVRAYAGRMVDGLQGKAPAALGPDRVLACAKHFLGDGGTTGGVDQGDTVLAEEELVALHAQGYLTALAAGAQTVMVSFSSWNGHKMHGNPYLLTEVLRGPLGFDGLVVGDWNGHGQVPGCSNESCAAAINAGIDLLMVPFDWEALIRNTLEQVRSGEITEARIDEAVTRILRVKMRAGLLGPRKDRGRPSTRPLAADPSVVGCAAHRAVAREAVRKSLVLLKNRGHVLPLTPGARILVAGKGAHDVGVQSGGWTLTWQGTDTNRDDFPHAVTLYEAIRERAPDAALDTSEGPVDVVVAVIGETPYAEGQGDLDGGVAHSARHPEDLALLDDLRARHPGVPVVTVFLTGRPLYVNPELNRSDAFLVAWLPGGQGGGVADVLFGDHDLQGRLSFTWPGRPQDTALNRGDAGALFDYGHGLRLADEGPTDPLPEHHAALDSEGPRFEVFTRGAGRNGYVLRATGDARVAAVDGRLQGSARRVQLDGAGGVELRSPRAPSDGYDRVGFRVRVRSGGVGAVLVCGVPLDVPADGEWHEVEIAVAFTGVFELGGAAGLDLDLEDVQLVRT